MAKKKNIKDVEVEEVVKEELETEVEEIEEETVEKKKTKKEKVKKEKVKKDTIGSELKKVVWPSAGSIVKYTLAVLIFCIFLGLFFKGIDLVSAIITRGLRNL